MLNSVEFPIAIVAHDAGAANHIIAWVKTVNIVRIRPYLAGPALALWQREFSYLPVGELAGTVAKAHTLISGTGWASNIEHEARKLAGKLGIRSIAVIDHWTNYRERFVRDGELVLPDEIWVVDEYAKKLAHKAFRDIKTVQLPNLYLENLVGEVREHERNQIHHTGANLLYVLEPIREAWGSRVEAGEFQGLDYFVEHLGCLTLGSKLSIKVRPHPSDPKGKYDDWLEAQKSLKIAIDDSMTLAEAIAWSDLVVGCQSYAMVVALAAGRRVISSIPSWAPPCVLPQSEIMKLSELTQ